MRIIFDELFCSTCTFRFRSMHLQFVWYICLRFLMYVPLAYLYSKWLNGVDNAHSHQTKRTTSLILMHPDLSSARIAPVPICCSILVCISTMRRVFQTIWGMVISGTAILLIVVNDSLLSTNHNLWATSQVDKAKYQCSHSFIMFNVRSTNLMQLHIDTATSVAYDMLCGRSWQSEIPPIAANDTSQTPRCTCLWQGEISWQSNISSQS